MSDTNERLWPWWQVTPRELARRHGCDPDRIRADGGDPDDLEDWQRDLIVEAVRFAESTPCGSTHAQASCMTCGTLLVFTSRNDFDDPMSCCRRCGGTNLRCLPNSVQR
jgi:hypothetical protein